MQSSWAYYQTITYDDFLGNLTLQLICLAVLNDYFALNVTKCGYVGANDTYIPQNEQSMYTCELNIFTYY